MLAYYKVGGSLHNNDPTYVVRSCDHKLYKALKAGEFCYIFNSRQMGKSSLLVRTKHQLEEEKYYCAVVDISQIGSQETTPPQWYKGVVIDLLRGFGCIGKLNLKSWWNEQEGMSLTQKLTELIDELLLRQFPQQNLCIFIDEIDSLLSLKFSVDDFFAWIRYCYNQRAINPEYKRLTFALFGVATPSDLIKDKSRTPFNIGTAINLEGFTLEEAQPLAQGLVGQIDNPEQILQEILMWTNGQPFLTQKLLRLVVFNLTKVDKFELNLKNKSTLWLQKLVREQIIERWESQDEPEHLRTIRDRILHNQQQIPRLLGIYQQLLQGFEILADDSNEQSELLLSGLVIMNQGILTIKNPIYKEIFNLSWVKKQLAKLRPYSQMFEAWVISNQQDDSRLLRGKALKDAQLWSQGKSLSNLDYQFLAASVEGERKELQFTLEVEQAKVIELQLTEQKQKAQSQKIFIATLSLALLISSSLGIVAFQQYRKATISEIKALAVSSQGLFYSNNQLDGMIAAIKAKRRLQQLGNVDQRMNEEVENALNRTIYNNNEFNQLIGHQGSVLSVDISPNNQLIVTASNDKTVKIWKLDGTLLKTLNHTATIHRVAFSPDSRRIVSGSLDGSLKLWGVDGQLIQDIPAHQSPIWGVAFSPNGQWIASASGDDTIKVWRLNGQLHQTLRGHQESVWNVAFSPDSQLIASAGVDHTVKLWSINGRLLKTLKGHQNPVWDVAFCPSHNLLVSVSSDLTAKIWKTDGTLVKTLSNDHSLLGVDCKGEFIATSGSDNLIKIWEIDGTLIKNLKQHQAIVRDVALSFNGLIAASASDDGTAKLWRQNRYLLKPIYAHQDTIWDLATSKDGQFFVSVSGEDTLKLWNSDGKLQQTLQQSLRSVEFSPDHHKLVTGGVGKTLQIWALDPRKKAPLKLLKTLPGHQASIFGIAIAPDGKTIASGSDDKTIKLWNFEGKLLRSIPAHHERIWKLDFSPDGQFLASASEDGTVKIWQKDGKSVATLRHQGAVWGMAFSPQGNLIVSGSRDNTLNFWKLDGQLLKQISVNSNGLTRVAFSPDGKTIATGGVDNTVKLWNTTGELLHTLLGHRGMVISLDFTADGSFLISGGDDGLMMIWDLKQIYALNNLNYACDWVRDYLRTNVEVEDSDHLLCP